MVYELEKAGDLGDGIVVAVFTNETCKICTSRANKVDSALNGKYPVYLVDMNKFASLAEVNGITKPGTVGIFRNGRLYDTFVGNILRQDIVNRVIRISRLK